jgi:hypothetical protein
LYRTYAPAGELQPYVKCYWILRADRNPFAGAEPLIPDCSTELISSAARGTSATCFLRSVRECTSNETGALGDRVHLALRILLIEWETGNLPPCDTQPG